MEVEQHGDADGHGRVYQLGRGDQYNIEKGYLSQSPADLPWLTDVALWPVVRESDPLELGVHRAPISDGNAVPRYVQRDIDEELRRQMKGAAEQGGMVLIIGDSTAGKSRAAYEAMQTSMPSHRIFAPDNAADVRKGVVALLSGADRFVIWLDDLDRYVSEEGLTVSMLRYLLRKRVAIVSTMRSERYNRLHNLASTSLDDHGYAIARIGDDILNLVEPLLLPRLWSRSELDRASGAGDERLDTALDHSDTYGLAEYMAAGPLLTRELRIASEGGGHPRGAAIVTAAIDLTRAGLPEGVESDMLREAHIPYLQAAGGALLEPETIDDALKWATARRFGVTGFLLPSGSANGYRVFDYLVDTAERSSTEVPQHVWDSVIAAVRDNDTRTYAVAAAASGHGRGDITESMLSDLAERGNSRAAYLLGTYLQSEERDSDARAWFQKAAEAGQIEAFVHVGLSLARSSDLEGAEIWFRRGADEGNLHAMTHLGVILRERGETKEAETLLRQAAGEEEGLVSLGQLLAADGRVQEAEERLREAADGGSIQALNALGVIFADLNRTDEAEEIWRSGSESGDGVCAFNLGALFANRRDFKESEKWFRTATERRTSGARGRLGAVLARQGRSSEAEIELRRSAEDSDASAMDNLAILLLTAGKNEEAERWARASVEQGESSARGTLASILKKAGKTDEAEVILREVAASGDDDASLELGALLEAQERWPEAQASYREAAERGNAEAACKVGRLLDWLGESDEAKLWLARSEVGGHPHASCVLGSLLLNSGDIVGAEAAWIRAIEGGHMDSAERLARMLAGVPGRGGDAAKWLRQARGPTQGKSAPRIRKKRRKPPGRRKR